MSQTTIKAAVDAAQAKLNWQHIDALSHANLGEFYADVCAQYKDLDAITNLGTTIQYGQLLAYGDALAAYFTHTLKLVAGDRVMVQLPNIIQSPIVSIACMRAGLVVVNTNPKYSAKEFEYQANDSAAKVLVTSAISAPIVDSVIGRTGIQHTVLTDIGDMLPWPKRYIVNFALRYVLGKVGPHNLAAAIPFRKALRLGAKLSLPPVTRQLDDIAMLQYTGGTTGVAKGAMLSHRNLLSNIEQFTKLNKTIALKGSSECLILPLPLYHIYAYMVCLVVMSTGSETVLITDPRDRKALVKTLAKKPFGYFVGLNTLFVALCNDEAFQDLDFSGLKATMSGGMALTPDAAHMWAQVTGCDVVEGYGLTETSPMILANSGQAIQLGTIGVPVPSTEIRIVGDNNEDKGVDEAGELWVRGPQVMLGYWQQPEATAEVLSDDGWFATGDIAVVAADGYVKIVDRKKDMIIVSGFNVFPNEVEAALVEHPNIVECAVVGVKDPAVGELVKAFIVSNDPNLTSDTVRQFCQSALAAYKIPRIVVFRDELPKSEVGKILRRKLRDE